MTTTFSPSRALPHSMNVMELEERLDTLWIDYLHALNQYTICQKQIQSHMSKGFLSLARANFNARNGLGRFGRDSFHERAVASRRVNISKAGSDGTIKTIIVQSNGNKDIAHSSIDDPIDRSGEAKSNNEKSSNPTQPSIPEPLDETAKEYNGPKPPFESQNGGSMNGDVESEEAEQTSKSKIANDPLRWFGILVPPELRAAQTNFISAMEEQVANAVDASRKMRDLEMEIRKLRKEIRKAEKGVSG